MTSGEGIIVQKMGKLKWRKFRDLCDLLSGFWCLFKRPTYFWVFLNSNDDLLTNCWWVKRKQGKCNFHQGKIYSYVNGRECYSSYLQSRLRYSGRSKYSACLSEAGYILGGIFSHTEILESCVFFFESSWLGAHYAVEILQISLTLLLIGRF